MSSTSGRLTERSQSPKIVVRSLETIGSSPLGVSTPFFGYFFGEVSELLGFATAGVLNRPAAWLLGSLAVFAVLLGLRCAWTRGTRVTTNTGSALAGLVVAMRGEDLGRYAAS